LGRLDEDEAKYWTNYAKKNGFSLRAQTMGKGEFERKVYTLHLHHLTGHLDMLFYELILASQKVELIMEYIYGKCTPKNIKILKNIRGVMIFLISREVEKKND